MARAVKAVTELNDKFMAGNFVSGKAGGGLAHISLQSEWLDGMLDECWRKIDCSLVRRGGNK